MPAPNGQAGDRQGTPLGLLARLWWMILGNVVLAFSLLFIFENRSGFFHTADWVFWIVVVSLVAIRYVDIRFLDGGTATGTRASMTHWTRYAALLAAGSTGAWVLAHVVSHSLAS